MSEIVNGAAVNETHANVKRSRSKYNLKQRVMDTMRFGEYHPHFVFDGVTSDKLMMRSVHNARSYTLKAPLMQNVQMHKDYFYVPLRAILPEQSDRIITNPTLGVDVPVDAYTCVYGFVGKIRTVYDAITTYISASAPSTDSDYYSFLTLFFKQTILVESVFSNGSLLASLGCNLSDCFKIQDTNNIVFASSYVNVDSFVNTFINKLLTALGTSAKLGVFIDGSNYQVVGSASGDSIHISIREFLMRIRDTANWNFTSFGSASTAIKSLIDDIFNAIDTGSLVQDWSNENALNVDLARVWAYHLCQAEFYTNDKVDYIYSADLFRQYIDYLRVYGRSNLPRSETHFNWNGLFIPYDFLCSHFFDSFVSLASNLSDTYYYVRLQYFLTLFGYHRSLRFKDYFTGSRTRPLAVGDVNAPVVSNQVSVVDVSRKIQLQRYLNSVNATGRKFEEYLKGIFGVAPSPDHHNPLFLAHTSDDIFTSEVENTGNAQMLQANSITAIFRGQSNKFAFEFEVKEPCIILGITSFDIERCYPVVYERSFATKDRFDMFLPELQYVGDQMVYRAELNPANNLPYSAFGYQFRDMDRKQLINRACGGFSNGSLPGFAFLYQRGRSTMPNITPDFIRSVVTELDNFYASLSGFSLGSYFHFIVSNDNIVEASRPMAVNPQILG